MNHYLLLATAWTWVLVLAAAMIRTRGLTPKGFLVAVGNREDLPQATPFASRADRAAKNMLENLLLFVCVWIAARSAGASGDRVLLGCRIFLVARIAHAILYLLGVPWLRTVAWAAGVVGMAIIGAAAW